MEILKVLQGARLFKELSEEEMRLVYEKAGGRIKNYKEGEIISSEGDKMPYIGIVLSGKLDVLRNTSDGDFVLIKRATPPYVFGIDVACTRSQVCPYTVTAAEDTCIYRIDFKNIERPGVIDESVRLKIMSAVLRIIAHDNLSKYYTIDILSRKTLRDRIIGYLDFERIKKGSDEFTISLNRENLANHLAVNRSALSNELSKMKKEGIIDFQKNSFKLLYKVK